MDSDSEANVAFYHALIRYLRPDRMKGMAIDEG